MFYVKDEPEGEFLKTETIKLHHSDQTQKAGPHQRKENNKVQVFLVYVCFIVTLIKSSIGNSCNAMANSSIFNDQKQHRELRNSMTNYMQSSKSASAT